MDWDILDGLITEVLDYWDQVEDGEADDVTENDMAEWFHDVPAADLRAVLGDHPDVEYRQVAAYALVACGHEEALPELRAARRSEDEWLAEIALCGCSRFDESGIYLDLFWEALAAWARQIRPEFEQMSLFEVPA